MSRMFDLLFHHYDLEITLLGDDLSPDLRQNLKDELRKIYEQIEKILNDDIPKGPLILYS